MNKFFSLMRALNALNIFVRVMINLFYYEFMFLVEKRMRSPIINKKLELCVKTDFIFVESTLFYGMMIRRPK